MLYLSTIEHSLRDKLMLENGMGLSLALPFVPGSDMAGTVEAIGSGVSRFKQGDRVISTFLPGWFDVQTSGLASNPPYHSLGGFYPGVLADDVAFPADWFSAAPTSLDDAEASTLPIPD